MTTETATIWIGDTPPSLNTVAGRGHWRHFANTKRTWEDWLAGALMAEAVPRGLAYVEASAVLRFPNRRRRDEGNYRSVLEKALGDTLVAGGWLADDTADEFRFGNLSFDTGGSHRTTIRLEFIREQEVAA